MKGKEALENIRFVLKEKFEFPFARTEEYNALDKALQLSTLVDNVKEWATQKGLDNLDPRIQYVKLIEEAGELASGLLKNKRELVYDSIGDMLVVMIILCEQLGTKLEWCLEEAWNEIKDRKGKTVNGVFIKQEDLPTKYRIQLVNYDVETNGDWTIPYDEPNEIVYYETKDNPEERDKFAENFISWLEDRVEVDVNGEPIIEKFEVHFEILGVIE